MRKKTENIGAPESHPDCVYMDIIFNGIINDGEYFKEYLIREAKKALDSRVELKEFFSRCAGVCIYLRQQRQKEYKNIKEHWEAQTRIGFNTGLKYDTTYR